MTILIVLVGLPGSGKTHLLQHPEFRNLVNPFIYSTDSYIEEKAELLQRTYTDIFEHYIAEATQEMRLRLQQAIKDSRPVVWDQTNMTCAKRSWILKQFPDNYIKNCLCIAPPRNDNEWSILELRLLSRVGKTIPNYVVDSMLDSYEEPNIAEGFDFVGITSISGVVLKQLYKK